MGRKRLHERPGPLLPVAPPASRLRGEHPRAPSQPRAAPHAHRVAIRPPHLAPTAGPLLAQCQGQRLPSALRVQAERRAPTPVRFAVAFQPAPLNVSRSPTRNLPSNLVRAAALHLGQSRRPPRVPLLEASRAARLAPTLDQDGPRHPPGDQLVPLPPRKLPAA